MFYYSSSEENEIFVVCSVSPTLNTFTPQTQASLCYSGVKMAFFCLGKWKKEPEGPHLRELVEGLSGKIQVKPLARGPAHSKCLRFLISKMLIMRLSASQGWWRLKDKTCIQKALHLFPMLPQPPMSRQLVGCWIWNDMRWTINPTPRYLTSHSTPLTTTQAMLTWVVFAPVYFPLGLGVLWRYV